MSRGISRPLAICASILLLALLFLYPTRPPFILTTSPSMPPGIYRIDYAASPKRGDIVVFRLPKEIENAMRSRPWFQPGIRYVKRVGALGGDVLCQTQSELRITDSHVLKLFNEDRAGYPLPHLPTGCVELHKNQFLPISEHFARSFDGRYYGPLPLTLVEGVATLLFPL